MIWALQASKELKIYLRKLRKNCANPDYKDFTFVPDPNREF